MMFDVVLLQKLSRQSTTIFLTYQNAGSQTMGSHWTDAYLG
jgi:hypothetical protein